MGKIEQLVGLCRTTLQRMENNSDIASALLDADHVFMLHGCSSLNDLLRPLSLSGDRGLLRSVAGRGDEVPARQAGTRGSARRSPPLQSLNQGELHQPDGAAMAQLSQRQTAPVLPLGSDDSSYHSQQIVQKLLDTVREELKTEQHKQRERGRSSQIMPFDVFHAAEEKNGLQSPKTMSGGRQRHRLTADHGHSASYPFSAIPLESEKTGWFERHPRHKTAAASLLPNELPNDSGQFISKNTLKTWAVPLPADDGLKEENILLQDKKKGGAVVASPHQSPSRPGEQGQASTLTVRRKISPFHADEPESRNTHSRNTHSRNTHSLLEPETASSSFPTQETPSSQLEQLLRKWKLQGSSQTTRGEWDQTAEEQASGVSTGPFPPRSNVPEDHGEWNTLEAEQQSPIDNDRVFSETLERVLKREIRRHGMEEGP